MQPLDIAEVILKLVEGQGYSDGTVVLKTIDAEKVAEVGSDKRERRPMTLRPGQMWT